MTTPISIVCKAQLIQGSPMYEQNRFAVYAVNTPTQTAFLKLNANQNKNTTKMIRAARAYGDGVGGLNRGSVVGGKTFLRLPFSISSSSLGSVGRRSYSAEDIVLVSTMHFDYYVTYTPFPCSVTVDRISGPLSTADHSTTLSTRTYWGQASL